MVEAVTVATPVEMETSKLEQRDHHGSRAVLTLYGGERSAKQLFSSLGKRKTPDDFNEQVLPNGITSTTVIPAHTIEEDDEKKTTFGNVFKSSRDLPALSTPRPSKHTTTRNSSVHWHTPSLIPPQKTPDRRGNYNAQPLPTGTWLNYNAPPVPGHDEEVKSKRKSRDRRLSYGEPSSPTSAEMTAAFSQAKNNALFQSVYSSFAPEKDDTLAIIPSEQKNRMWWSKYGHERYQDLLDVRDASLYDGESSGDENEDINLEEMKAIADKWVPPQISDYLDKTKSETSEGILNQISDLIEALNTYQRARHEIFPSSSRVIKGGKVDGNGLANPSADEVGIYDALESHLSSLISDLPPYLLAKIDGNKLEELRISTRIQLPSKNQRGTLEEEELSAVSKPATHISAPIAANQTNASYTNLSARGGYAPQGQTPSHQYPRSPYNTSARTSVANAYPANHFGARSASQYQTAAPNRSSYSSTYGPQRAPTYANRFPNGNFNSPHAYNPYANGHRTPSQQQSNPYVQQQSTSQSRMPISATASMQGYRGTATDYQQRAPIPPAYNYGTTPNVAGGSPQPPYRAYSAQGQSPAQGQSSHQQSPHQHRPQYFHQSPPTHGSRIPPEPQTNGISGRGASPREQERSRPKAQMHEQYNRQSSETPQPLVENGGVQENGTFSSQ